MATIDESLHVYAQSSWHEPVTIVGTRDALERLSALIAVALQIEESDGLDFSTSDGEGYTVRVICTDDESKWNTFRLPYTDEDASGWQEGKIIP